MPDEEPVWEIEEQDPPDEWQEGFAALGEGDAPPETAGGEE